MSESVVEHEVSTVRTKPSEVGVNAICLVSQTEHYHLDVPEETGKLLLKLMTVSGTSSEILEHFELWTLSSGILTMFSTVRNSIPMNTNVWAGINSDFSQLIVSPKDMINRRVNCLSLGGLDNSWFLTNRSSRYGNGVIALFLKCSYQLSKDIRTSC